MVQLKKHKIVGIDILESCKKTQFQVYLIKISLVTSSFHLLFIFSVVVHLLSYTLDIIKESNNLR